jgi:hypothetical protein
MSLSPLDSSTGTGPLPPLSVVMAETAAVQAADVRAALAANAERAAERPAGAGTAVLQGYGDDPYLVMPNDEGAADGETTGQLVMQWQPPTDADAEAWDELQKAKDQTAEAARERVILGATGQPVRVVGV